MKMQIVNLTPHDAVIFAQDGKTIIATIPASGNVARLEETTVSTGTVRHFETEIEIFQKQFGQTEGLPEPQDGFLFFVSALVAQRNPSRGDLLIPARGVRNQKGEMIGTIGLCRV